MINNRILPATVAAALILTGAGCRGGQEPGRHTAPDPRGARHKVEIVVKTTISGRPHFLPVHYHADVTIPDRRPGHLPGAIRHGLSVRDGKTYPDSWDADSNHPTTVYYWDGSNPTTFTLGATLDASAVSHMPAHQQIVMTCSAEKDGHEVILDERSHPWAAITVSQAQSGMVKSIGVLCVWVDR